MTLEEYKVKYEGTDPIETPTKELVEAWLDDKIAALRQVSEIYDEHGFDLVWGEYVDNDFENEIIACGWHELIQVQIYTGIEKLAELLGVQLKRGRKSPYSWEYYFTYKGIKVLELSKEEY